MLGTFEGQIQKAGLLPMSVLIVLIVVVSIASSDLTRGASLDISRPTTYDIARMEIESRTWGVAQELEAQVKEPGQHLGMAANLTNMQLPVVQRLSQRVWAQTNAEANLVPDVDGSNLAKVGAFFQLGLASFAQLDAHPNVNLTENTVMIMRPLLAATPEILQLYVADDSNLIFWLERTYHRADNYRSSSFLNGCTGRFEVGYKPSCDPWYLLAKAAPAGKIVFVPPYIDYDTGVLTLTLSTTLSTPGNPVFGLDRDMTAMDLAVQGVPGTLTDNGYRALIHKNGNVISHPLFTNRTALRTIQQLDPLADLDWPLMLQIPVLPLTPFKKGSTPWVISCAPVPTADWVVCYLAPSGDLTAVGDTLKRQSVDMTIVECCVMIFVAILCVLYLYRHNKRSAKPVVLRLQSFGNGFRGVMSSSLTTFVAPPASQPIRRAGREVPPATDLRATQRACDQLLAGLRLNMLKDDGPNDLSTRRLNLERVNEAIEIFRTSNNQRALGVAHVMRSKRVAELARRFQEPSCSLELALEDIETAIAISRVLVSGADGVPALESDKLALATRLMNKGNLLADLGRSAKSAYDESEQKHTALDNVAGFVPVAINKARALLTERQDAPQPADHETDHKSSTPVMATVLASASAPPPPIYIVNSIPGAINIEMTPLQPFASASVAATGAASGCGGQFIMVAPAPIVAPPPPAYEDVFPSPE